VGQQRDLPPDCHLASTWFRSLTASLVRRGVKTTGTYHPESCCWGCLRMRPRHLLICQRQMQAPAHSNSRGWKLHPSMVGRLIL
jgi:hypothetical protein